MSKLKIFFLSQFLFFGIFSLSAENFRISKIKFINVTQSPDFESSVKLNINDGLVIFVPKEHPYIDGLEVKISIPEEIAVTRNTCECLIYDKLKPEPSSDQIDYAGEKIFNGIIPGKFSWIIQIPFNTESKKIKTNQFTTKLDKIPDLSNNYIFLRLNQLISELNETFANADFTFTVRPIYSNYGNLLINLTANGKDVNKSSVLIDDVSYELSQYPNGIKLTSGLHNITVISDEYRTEVRTIRVEQARLTNITILLKSINPSMIINAPENVNVYLDNAICNSKGKEFPVTEGDHIIKYKIGNYELIRTVNVQKGHTYKIDLVFDMNITEE